MRQSHYGILSYQILADGTIALYRHGVVRETVMN